MVLYHKRYHGSRSLAIRRASLLVALLPSDSGGVHLTGIGMDNDAPSMEDNVFCGGRSSAWSAGPGYRKFE